MKRFKLRPGRQYIPHDISRENFERLIRGKEDYKQRGKDGKLRCFAVCPACDNPIQLIGLYNTSRNTVQPYRRHYNRSISIAPHNQQNYISCPYACLSHSVTRDTRKDKLTDFEREIYYSLRDNFDLAIYVLQQDSGIYISRPLAKKILSEYIGTPGYMYFWATLYNIPWMLGYFMVGCPLYGKAVRKGSALHSYLENRENVRLMPGRLKGYDIVGNDGKYLNLCYSFIFHDRKIIDDEVKETISLSLWTESSDTPIPTAEHDIQLTINEVRFPRLIQKAKYRDKELLDMAKEMMPDLGR